MLLVSMLRVKTLVTTQTTRVTCVAGFHVASKNTVTPQTTRVTCVALNTTLLSDFDLD